MTRPMTRRLTTAAAVALVVVLATGMAACTRDQDALPDPNTVAPATTPQMSTGPSTRAPSATTASTTGPASTRPATVDQSATARPSPVTSASPTSSNTRAVPPTTWVTQPATGAPTAPNTAATLPPPTQDPSPAATSGPLHLDSQPRPPGWTPTAAHAPTATRARDPRYAAWEAMMVGCAPVDRRTWIDPAHALEVAVSRDGRPGVGLIMQFSSQQAALRYLGAFEQQLGACPARPSAQQPGVIRIESAPGLWLGRRLLPDGSVWAEVATVSGATVRLWILQDAGGMDDAQLRALAAHLAG